jgi:hypothetical protein
MKFKHNKKKRKKSSRPVGKILSTQKKSIKENKNKRRKRKQDSTTITNHSDDLKIIDDVLIHRFQPNL